MTFKFFKAALLLLMFSTSLQAESLFKIDFSQAPEGNAKQWLHLSNFALQRDAKTLLKPFIEKGQLVLEIGPDMLGGLALRRDIPGAKRVEVIWGVNKYPQGANWEKGNNREAAMFLVAFGKELLSSDAWVLPSLPYFIGAFLGEMEKEGAWYKAVHYTEGGSYTCLPCGSKKGTLVTTNLELPNNFQAQFKKPMPDVIGFGFEFDTRNTLSDSVVVIQSIEFFDE